jgi:hypothetical protein
MTREDALELLDCFQEALDHLFLGNGQSREDRSARVERIRERIVQELTKEPDLGPPPQTFGNPTCNVCNGEGVIRTYNTNEGWHPEICQHCFPITESEIPF